MKHYLHEVSEVFAEVKSTENGLTSAEAQKRLEENGKNKLAEAKKASMLSRFIDQLKDPMIIILLVAAVIFACKQNISLKTGVVFAVAVAIWELIAIV